MASSTGGGGRDALPQRSTRGKRMRAAMEEEEDADQEFWNQEFFAEEADDVDYQSEEEEEDVVDSDFDEPEDDADDDDEDQDVKERPKRKALKAPEPKGPPKAKTTPKPAAAREEPSAGGAAPEDRTPTPTPPPASAPPTSGKMRGTRALLQLQQGLDAEQQALLLQEQQHAAPTLRRSTVARVQEAQKERKQKQQAKPARPRSAKSSEWRPMTQAELLAEAARTEVDNMYSLKILLAMEEETKKKAVVTKQQYRGPLVKWISRKRLAPNAPPALAPTKPSEQQQKPEGAAAVAAPAAAAAAQDKPATAAQQAPSGSGGGPMGPPSRTPAPQDEEEAPKAAAAGHGADAPLNTAALDTLLRYEGTLAFELHNMHYPPLWLRRWKAPQPPGPAQCVVTGAPAHYRDPATKCAFSTRAAYRRLKGLPATDLHTKPPTPPPAQPPAMLKGGFNAATCVFAGAAPRHLPTPAVRRALAALPQPPPPPLPPPTVQLTLVHPLSLPTPLMSLAMDVTKVPAPPAS